MNDGVSNQTAIRVPILSYHKVGPVAQFGRRLNIEPTRLESHVRFFSRRNYRFLTGRELGQSWPARGVVFTFDDGFAGAIEEGLPRLERHGARGTVYAVTGLVGRESKWEGESPFPLADWDSLRDAAKRGHEIGNHTVSHPRLAALSSDAQFEEIDEAERTLNREGLAGGSFCLPYGSYSAATIEALRRSQVSVCVTTRKGIAAESDDRLLLPRISVAFGDSLPLLVYRLYMRPLIPKLSGKRTGGPMTPVAAAVKD